MLINFSAIVHEPEEKYYSCDEREIINEISRMEATENELENYRRIFEYAALSEP